MAGARLLFRAPARDDDDPGAGHDDPAVSDHAETRLVQHPSAALDRELRRPGVLRFPAPAIS